MQKSKQTASIGEKHLNDVTVINHSESLSREGIQRMMEACGKRRDPECLVCAILRKKLEASPDQKRMLLPINIEVEQSRIVRQHFPLCTPPADLNRGSLDSTASIGQQALGADASILKFGIGGVKSTGGDQPAAQKLPRDSQLSDPGAKQGGDTRALNYGLHNLIQEIDSEPNQNHQTVFKNLEQSQLNSLLAQVTCKDTLFKENESNAKLLRIEQELNDLMNREDVARLTQDSKPGSGVGGVTSKKINHEHGY
ncbi:hypothetical protein BOX15_Mlig016553g1 [Macrostomum lignano]|uniref:Uncharacterized protein n=1 Tax=Macrostomum lignano TaxID=282301 RepID=A0A267GR51_9PLAT|nr:hypothetical protein BOX15_Mlig016553g1 [Macrostomum lignano]